MGNLENMLKTEIERLTRKELAGALTPLQKEIRDLSRQVKALQGQVQRGSRRPAAAPATPGSGEAVTLEASPAEVERARISPGLIKKLRAKFGITQSQLAALVDVSPAAVQSWEQGIARPGDDNKAILVALRNKTRPEVTDLLEAKGVAKSMRKPRTNLRGRRTQSEADQGDSAEA